MILCDTNIFIEVYKNNSTIISVLEKIGQERIAASQVTSGELVFGALNKRELAAIHSDLQKISIIPISTEISQLAFDLMLKFSLSHHLALPDALIAATAISFNLELYTLNLKDFKFIPGINLYK